LRARFIAVENSFFSEIVKPQYGALKTLDLSGGGKALIISDLHMGTGRNDDLAHNGELLISLLDEYYFRQGWSLVLNGDIEELQRHSLAQIRDRWPRLYQVYDEFYQAGRLYKVLGNHDEGLVFEKNYPYPVCNAVRIETGKIPVYVYHGHQSSRFYSDYNAVLGMGIRYILKPFGIRNTVARNPYRRFFVEKKAYRFSLENNCISIIGHTHRPLFESLGRFDYIKFEIERLCRDYPASVPEDRERIAGEVAALQKELRKLKRKERRNVLRQSLYGDELPVPCLFNSGSAIGKKGVNAIELDRDHIALVYWFVEGRGKKFVSRGWYDVDRLPGTDYRRAVLNNDRIDYIKARIELLGNGSSNTGAKS
jgi:predicted phosphodiesterase